MKNNQITYHEDKKQILIKCLEKIEDRVIISSSSKPKIEIDLYYYFVKEILLENINFNKDLPERTRRSILNLSIFRWINYKKVTNPNHKLRLFIGAVNCEFRFTKKQLKNYSVLMFMNIDTNSIRGFQNIALLGETIKTLTWNEVFSLDLGNLWNDIRFQDKNSPLLWGEVDGSKPTPDIDKFSPILFDINSYSPGAAVEIAVERFDLFRAMINLSLIINRYTYFRSVPQALSKILPSPVYVILNQKKLVNFFYNVEKYKYKKEKIPDDKKEFISKLVSRYGSIPHEKSSWNFLKNILLLYQNSLDIVSPEFTFLSMWQVLENCLTLNENSINNQQILTRVKHLINCDPFVVEILKIIVNTRNKYVHKGKFLEEGDPLLFNLKLITDSVIDQMINLAEIYPSLQELKEYFSLKTLGNNDLIRKKIIIESILTSREKSNN